MNNNSCRELNGIHETVHYDRVKGLKIFRNVESDDYALHWHTDLEIIVPIENYYRATINDNTFTIQPGEFLLIAPGTMHTLEAPDNGMRLIMQLDYSQLANITEMDSLLHLMQPYIYSNSLDIEDARQLSDILLQIETEYQNSSAFSAVVIYSLLLQFLSRIGRIRLNETTHFDDIPRSKQHEYVDNFIQITSYISEHCTENLSLEDLATLAGFSKFHFARLFKQFSGMTWFEYLTSKRILFAEKLLTNPDISIVEVAMRSGFNSLSTFNRIFKKAKGCTPSQYKSHKH